METLRRLFPTLAEWPAAKWMVLPIALAWIMASVLGIYDCIVNGWW